MSALRLSMKERGALKRLAKDEANPTVALAAEILLLRDDGGSYRNIGADVGRSHAFCGYVIKDFLGGGRMECQSLRKLDRNGRPKRPFGARKEPRA